MRTPRRPTLPRAVHSIRYRSPLTLAVAGVLVISVATGTAALATAMTGPAPTHQAAPAPAAATTATASTPKPKLSQSAVSAAAPPVNLVTPVPRPKHLIPATLLVSSAHPLSGHQRHALASLSGVHHTEGVSAGKATVDHHRAFVLGVDAATFRPWTPKLTAKSNPLWASVARGDLTASFDMGHNAKLPLGHTVAVKSRRVTPLRIGAFASVGMAGVDGIVNSQQARRLGLRRHTADILSAPGSDPLALRKQALAIAGPHAKVEVLQEVVVTRDAGEFISRHTISTFLHAAASRVGLPYVWGATGPNSFDCSGLVQWSFARAGITMPRVSEDQWLTGPHIPYQDARPGDLLFWHYDPTDPGNIDHVAIYAGNGMMLVAPHTGENVSYKPVPLADFAGVVRVDPALAGELG